MTAPTGAAIVLDPGWAFRLMTVLTFVAGTSFIMWLGEQITERGIGNGISLIIFSGIVARLPSAIISTYQLMSAGEISLRDRLPHRRDDRGRGAGGLVRGGPAEDSDQYAKRVVGRKMAGGQESHLPLKVNTSGVIPPIFASSIILFPATIAQFSNVPWMQDVSAMLSRAVLFTSSRP